MTDVLTEACVGCSRDCDASVPDDDGDGFLCHNCAQLPGPKTHRANAVLNPLDETPLARRGIKKVLEVVLQCNWLLAAASRKLTVTYPALTRYLERNAPEEIAKAREHKLIRRGGLRCPEIQTREKLLALLNEHQWNLSQAGWSLKPSTYPGTIVAALKRLAPEEYEAAKLDGRIKLGRH